MTKLSNDNVLVNLNGINKVYTQDQLMQTSINNQTHDIIQSGLLRDDFGIYAVHNSITGRGFRTQEEAIIAGGLSRLQFFENPGVANVNSIEQFLLGSSYRAGHLALTTDTYYGGYGYYCIEVVERVSQITVFDLPRFDDFHISSGGGIFETELVDATRPYQKLTQIGQLPEQIIYMAYLIPKHTSSEFRLHYGQTNITNPEFFAMMTHFYTMMKSMSNEEQTAIEELFSIRIEDYNPLNMMNYSDARWQRFRNDLKSMLDAIGSAARVAGVVLGVAGAVLFVVSTVGGGAPIVIGGVSVSKVVGGAATVAGVVGAASTAGIGFINIAEGNAAGGIVTITQAGLDYAIGRGVSRAVGRVINIKLPNATQDAKTIHQIIDVPISALFGEGLDFVSNQVQDFINNNSDFDSNLTIDHSIIEEFYQIRFIEIK